MSPISPPAHTFARSSVQRFATQERKERLPPLSDPEERSDANQPVGHRLRGNARGRRPRQTSPSDDVDVEVGEVGVEGGQLGGLDFGECGQLHIGLTGELVEYGD